MESEDAIFFAVKQECAKRIEIATKALGLRIETFSSYIIAGGLIPMLYDTYSVDIEAEQCYQRTDVDIYLTTDKRAEIKAIVNAAGELGNHKGFQVYSNTSRALTIIVDSVSYQFIKMHQGNPERDITPTFDYEHCKAYYSYTSNTLNMTKRQLDMIQNKYTIHYPPKSVNDYDRARKWHSRGYKVYDENKVEIP